jgi:type-F conjugative transfer system pilin assembly protein TrbC
MHHAAVAQDTQASIKIVQEALEKAKKMKKHITVPGVDKNNRAAQEAARTFYSPEYQNKIGQEIERLKNTLFADTFKDQKKQPLSKPAPGSRYFLMPDERIYVFISSSVPVETLRNYAADLDRLRDPHVTMVMRGFVKGMKLIKPTLDFIRKVIVKDPDCDITAQKCDAYRVTINIDPLLFRRYGINQVPAIVYANGVSLVDAGQSEGIKENAPVSDAYMLSGDVSLAYALEKINREAHSPELEAVLRQLRAGFYNKRSEIK